MLQNSGRFSIATTSVSSTILQRLKIIRTVSTNASDVENNPEMSSKQQIKTSLNERHRIIAEGGIPPLTYDYEKEKWAQRTRFGLYGLASGVDIRKLWPTVEVTSGVDIRKLWPTVEEAEEAKAMKFYRKYDDAREIAIKNKTAKIEAVKKKLEEVRKNEENYEKKLADYYASQVKAETEKSEQEKVMERRIREIQEYFGYWIDPNDPRFEVMLKQKEAEEKKAEKMAKRAAAEKKKIAASS
uniref:Large ribosomal subunit protein mL64 n=1 Tax=Panagrolaimus sp. JU765 TaxID=591449 RepID=A0AC34QWX2_9BILA